MLYIFIKLLILSDDLSKTQLLFPLKKVYYLRNTGNANTKIVQHFRPTYIDDIFFNILKDNIIYDIKVLWCIKAFI